MVAQTVCCFWVICEVVFGFSDEVGVAVKCVCMFVDRWTMLLSIEQPTRKTGVVLMLAVISLLLIDGFRWFDEAGSRVDES